jgi:hypothetical protein
LPTGTPSRVSFALGWKRCSVGRRSRLASKGRSSGRERERRIVSLCSRVRGWGDGGSSERGRESGFVDGGIRGRIESLEREGWCIRRTGGGWGDRAGRQYDTVEEYTPSAGTSRASSPTSRIVRRTMVGRRFHRRCFEWCWPRWTIGHGDRPIVRSWPCQQARPLQVVRRHAAPIQLRMRMSVRQCPTRTS